jgi:hypothetical protein
MKTYECKIKDESAYPFIRDMNSLFGIWVRKLFVFLYANPVEDKNLLKRSFQKEMGVSSTHYNSIKNHVDGSYKARQELGVLQLKDLTSGIKHTQKTIKKLEKSLKKEEESIARIRSYLKARALHKQGIGRKPRKLRRKIDLENLSLPKAQRYLKSRNTGFKIHQKKRRLGILEQKAKKLETQKDDKKWSLCFGSKKLLRKQHYLAENGYSSHKEWKEDWTFHRNNQSYWLGDSTEKANNRNAKLNFNGSLASLRLTVPEALRSKYGSFVSISNLNFDSRAEEQIKNALNSESGKSPLSYRLLERQKTVHDKDGNPHQVRQVYLQVSLEESYEHNTGSRESLGAIGVDLNADHFAMGEVDHSGNPIRALHIDFFKVA